MHPLILVSGLCAGAFIAVSIAAAPAPGTCPPSSTPVHEDFVPADCAACWATADLAGKSAWRLDWIVPGAPDAPMAVAALPEAAERAARAASVAPNPATRQLGPGQRIGVASGPAWKGYFGVQITLQAPAHQPWPAGATAWVALVEQVPAGTDGTPVARSLVRAVAGPLPVGHLATGQPMRHLRAMRWPGEAEPTRLRARGWVEAADGRILAMTADRCP